jgi:hypothetical protein
MEKKGLTRGKRLAGKMWDEHLKCCKLRELLFVTPLEHGMFIPCMR